MSEPLATAVGAAAGERPLLGWREWVVLPQLHLQAIRAKVDTGAKTCALHAFYVEPYRQDGSDWVRFGMHPQPKRLDVVVHCQAPLVDRRDVTDSGGHREQRYVIETTLRLGRVEICAEVTLTDREIMQYRMLIGRNALSGFLIDPARSYCLGRKRASALEDAATPKSFAS